jgi:hypothetical protein
MRRHLIPTAAAAVLLGCNGLSPDTYWRSGDYELIAIDVKGQMDLSVDVGNGDAIAVVGPTVFSLGANDKYIVVKQHPAKDGFGAYDRSVTNYYVVTRLAGPPWERDKGVRGPLTKERFAQLSVIAGLPGFTKTFQDLQ